MPLVCRKVSGHWRVICEHNKRYEACSKCHNYVCPVEGCPQARRRFAASWTLREHLRTVHSGDRIAMRRGEQLVYDEWLSGAGIASTPELFVPFRVPGAPASETRCAFVDMCVETDWGLLLIEIDERQHRKGADYWPHCDPRRDMDTLTSMLARDLREGRDIAHVVILRVNPGPFRVGDQRRNPGREERRRRFVGLVKELMERRPPEAHRRLFLWYDRDAEGDAQPSVAKDWQPGAAEISVALAD